MRQRFAKKGWVRAVLVAGALVAAVPATAGGSFGVTVTAQNGAERRAISRAPAASPRRGSAGGSRRSARRRLTKLKR